MAAPAAPPAPGSSAAPAPATAVADGWQLTDAQRQETVARLAANLASLAFFRDRAIGADAAEAAALAIERRAYTAAQVSARTTTGCRPAAETTSAYARKMGELVVEAVKAGVPAEHPHHAAPAADAAGGGGHWHDLSAAGGGGGRDFLDEEGARRALAPLLAPGAAVARVRLSTKSFGAAAAAVAADALRNVAGHLSHADLSDIIAGRPEDEALSALRAIAAALSGARGLRHLDVSDNALGEKGVRALAAALGGGGGGDGGDAGAVVGAGGDKGGANGSGVVGGGGSRLEYLALKNVGCSVHACAAVEELVVGGELRGLHLHNNMSGDEGAEHIARVLARARRMQDFRMASSRVGTRGGGALARALASLPASPSALARLDLSDNPLTAACASALAACVAHHAGSLVALNLNDTSLTDAGIALVCGALAPDGAAPRLEELELALNEITPRGAVAVARALAGSGRRLRRLNLRENELGDEGVLLALRGPLEGGALPALEHLDLCGNQLGRAGAVGVARALASASPRPPLACLALDENAISEAGVELLRAVVKGAFGGDGVLGPLDDNDADGADEDEDEENEEEGGGDGDGDDGGLSAAMAGVKV